MNATSIEPARPASEHLVSLSHHSYLIRSVSGSDELALFDMFARSSPEDLRLRCLGMIKDFPRLAAARLAHCDRGREIALVAVDGEGAAPGEIVGVAHLIEEPTEPGCAEFDILVRTDVKGHGVGFQLMKDVLARARERRLTKIVGFIAGAVLFFTGLFVMVGALVKTGVVNELARLATTATGGHALLTTMLILGVSFVFSGIINNVPYAATMAPIVGHLLPSMVGHVNPQVLWWALVLGTDLGGNLTAVGASANVVILGIARRADSPISFWEFTRKGVIVTGISIGLSAIYLWLRYFVWS